VLTTITPIPIGIDEEKERILINKFLEYRQFKINWVERDSEGWLKYKEKNYNEVILPVAIKSDIV
jgi:DNA-binding response OmpR family regulator